MFPLWPYQKLVLESPFGREEIIQRLGTEVAKPNWSWVEKRTELFEGTVTDQGFRISRIIRYRNSFLPVIHGRFTPLANGVRVDVRMMPHVAVLIFCAVWLGGVLLAVVATTATLFTTGEFQSEMLTPFGMLLFFYILITVSFGIEATKARELLRRILEGEEGEG